MKKSDVLKNLKKYVSELRDNDDISDNYAFVMRKAENARLSLVSSDCARFPHADELYILLMRYEYRMTEQELDCELKAISTTGEAISDDELKILHPILIFCCIRAIASGEYVQNAIMLLYSLEFFNYNELYVAHSELQWMLLSYPDYHKSDKASRALYVKRLEGYAKKIKKTPQEALRGISAGEFTTVLCADRHRISRALYFPLIITVWLTFAVLEGLLVFASGAFYAVIPFALSQLPLYECAVYLVNYSYGKLFPPDARFALSSEHLPSGVKTLAVITALPDGDDSEMTDKLEQYYLSNKYDGLLCGILADLPDNDKSECDDDEKIINGLAERLKCLCEKYGDVFYLFYRKRAYSITQGCFMAPDRKRGAVSELCRLLYTGNGDISVCGNKEGLKGVRYLITLDLDTILPPRTSHRLTCIMEHPANKAVFDGNGKLLRGCGILQPCIDTLFLGKKTAFALMSSGNGGIQSYRGARFDIYEEIFDKGIFCGKGIINCEAFYKTVYGVLPQEKILSHDVVEGCLCNAAMVPDISFYDGTPSNALSYYKRLDRWVRGDVQTYIAFCGRYIRGFKDKKRNPLTAFDKYKLFDNVRRDLTPFFALLAMICASFFSRSICTCIAVFSLFYLIVPTAASAFEHIIQGAFGVRRRFYSFTLSQFWHNILFFLFKVVSLGYDAFVGARASVCALWRTLVSGKRMLEWVCASKAEKTVKNGFLPYFIKGCVGVIAGAYFLIFVPYGIYRITGALMFVAPVVLYIMRKSPEKSKVNASEAQKQQVREYVKDMWSYFEDTVTEETNFLPVDNVAYINGERISYHTSPTNIGMYLLSTLGAYDFELIDEKTLKKRITDTISTIERLKKYKGNLYNWYDVRSLNTSSGFVSFVDSGNLLCALVCVEQAIRQMKNTDCLAKRIRMLYEKADLGCMYDGDASMFYIGTDDKNGVTVNNHYDMHMSEARTGCYLAFAMGKINTKCNTQRTLLGKNGYIGLASWTGTAFEYFMPCLFLPRIEGSFEDEALKYAYRRQKETAVKRDGKPFIYGMSESCFFELDGEMNYQYKAHGSFELGLKSGLWEDNVISPYSSFLMLCMSSSPLKNLTRLRKYGAYGKYGFYEAVDLTEKRTHRGYAVIKSYMSHHIGMSIVACANFAFDGIFVKRFTADPYIKSSLCTLYEMIPTEDAPYKRRTEEKEPTYTLVQKAEETERGIISNGMCHAEVSGGNISLKYGDILLNGDTGVSIYTVANGKKELINDGDCVCDNAACELYLRNKASSVLSLCADKNVFCISVSSPSSEWLGVSFLPIMTTEKEHYAHVSYSRLFITLRYESGVLIYERRKNGRSFYVCIIAVGEGHTLPIKFRYANTSDYCGDEEITEPVCPVTPIAEVITPYERANFLISCGFELERAKNELFEASNVKNLPLSNREQISKLYKTVLHNCFCRSDIMCAYLKRTYRESCKGEKSFYGAHTLWKYGIPSDMPILVLDITNEYLTSSPPFSVLSTIATHKSMMIRGAKYCTVILYTENNSYCRESEKNLTAVVKAMGAMALLGQRNGIFLVECTEEKEKEFFSDVSFFPYSKPEAVLRGRLHTADVIGGERKHRVTERSVEISNGHADVPWSYIYSNESFGTLVTDLSLGYSWYVNSRTGKLTEHTCDVLNYGGEAVYLEYNGELFDIVKHRCTTEFCDEKAVYTAHIADFSITVEVCCDAELPEKHVSVKITNTSDKDVNCEICYKADFVMGETAQKHGALCGEKGNKSLRIIDVYGNMPDCFISSKSGCASEFNGRSGVVRCLLNMKRASSRRIEFTLGVGRRTLEHKIPFDRSALLYKRTLEDMLNVYILDTGDAEFDMMFNKYAKYQALYCRVYARCSFYQSGGAFGFRDQLQDMLCIMYFVPEYAREHLLLCGAHQYLQGDVMHWWHPGVHGDEMGVRTRISDDRLWLPFVLAKYVELTGDDGILFTPVPYLSSPVLEEWENDRYEMAVRADEREGMYAHCVRAVNASLNFGKNGIPLFGGGDWNDGMNNVKGESVWLGWFMCGVLDKMAYLAETVKDRDGAEKYRQIKKTLTEHLEMNAYNGRYYVRGTYENGDVIGCDGSGCEIDILPQAFAAMFGENTERIRSCMSEAEKVLYDKDGKLFLLFSPPFDGNGRYAGYICDYPMGIRENGGQYTHGAIWGASGFLQAGMNDTAYRLICDINPLKRSENEDISKRYKGEPYVLSSDIYSNASAYGRCGWSWYTGAAGWYFTTVLEGLLGYSEKGGSISADPKYGKKFTHFRLTVRKNSKTVILSGEKGKDVKITLAEG